MKTILLFVVSAIAIFFTGCTMTPYSPQVIGNVPSNGSMIPRQVSRIMPWDQGFASEPGRDVGQLEFGVWGLKVGVISDTAVFVNDSDNWVRLGDEYRTYAWVGPRKFHSILLSRLPSQYGTVRITGEVYRWGNRNPVHVFVSHELYMTEPQRDWNGRVVRHQGPQRYNNYRLTLSSASRGYGDFVLNTY